MKLVSVKFRDKISGRQRQMDMMAPACMLSHLIHKLQTIGDIVQEGCVEL